MEKRKDNKGRILRDGEYQKSDGRYEFRYLNHIGELKSVYSWRLVETDKTPNGKRKTDSLREIEKTIKRDLEDGIIVQKKLTLNKFWEDYIAQKRELKQSTATNYKYMYKKYVKNVIGDMNITTIKYSTMKKFFNERPKIILLMPPDMFICPMNTAHSTSVLQKTKTQEIVI